MRILKTASCPSLSGSTTLKYQIGILEDQIYFRLQENSSGGLFSKDWIPLEQMELATEKPITSSSLQVLFKGKSANTGGFIMAVLRKEKLIHQIVGKKRIYLCCDPSAFNAAMKELVEATPKKKRSQLEVTP